MLSKNLSYDIIDFVIKEAEGYDTQVIVFSSEEGLTRFANSEIHQNVFQDETTVSITIFDGKKQSKIKTSLYNEDGLRETVKDALTNLEFLLEGELELPLISSPELIENDDYSNDLVNLFGIEERAKVIQKGINILETGYKAYGALSYKEKNLAYGNSTGIKRYNRINSLEFSTLIISETGGSGYAEFLSNRIEDIDIIGGFKTAYDKAKMNKDPEGLEPGAYTVILEPLAVGDILTYFAYIGFSGKSIQNGSSFLIDKKGNKIFDEKITIIDDYTDENTISLPFDFEGTQRQKVKIIENGVAKDLLYDQASGIKDGVDSTGHSLNVVDLGGLPCNLVMSSGDQSVEEIIQNTENGLLITRFHYMNIIDPRKGILTGLTRDGVFKIEKGKIVGAIKNMRFTENMMEAFNRVEAISQERARTLFADGNFNYYVPALKINGFHFTGKTEA
ncbi:MAG: TldD/PmbA family protein [Halanaerobiales bacterium]|nr:TldD/PmbA family protein [Halanaerobiales bacterium]